MKLLAISAIFALFASINSWSVTLESETDLLNFCQGKNHLYLAARNLNADQASIDTSSSSTQNSKGNTMIPTSTTTYDYLPSGFYPSAPSPFKKK